MKRLFLIILLLALAPAVPAAASDLLVIANASVDVTAPLGHDQIAAIYLLRKTTWPDGSHIVPVNREAGSELRAKFTLQVLGQDDEELAAYWNEMHFKGQLPPVVQESDQAVMSFVQNVPGAIGYVSATLPLVHVRVLARVH